MARVFRTAFSGNDSSAVRLFFLELNMFGTLPGGVTWELRLTSPSTNTRTPYGTMAWTVTLTNQATRSGNTSFTTVAGANNILLASGSAFVSTGSTGANGTANGGGTIGSASGSGTFFGETVSAPTRPTSLSATTTRTDGVNLTWSGATGSITNYGIWWHPSPTGNPTNSSTPDFNTTSTSFLDTQILAGNTRYYWVRSQGSGGNSDWFPTGDGILGTRAAAAAPTAPVWQTATTLPNAVRGSAYSTTVVASPATSYQLLTYSGPAGLSLSSGGTISGTPTTTGTLSIGVRAVNTTTGGTATTDRTFTISVLPPPPSFSDQSITTTWIKTLNFSGAPDRTVSASDTTSYSIITSGTGLDPTGWLTINNSGQLSGLPSPVSGQSSAVGVYTFRIRASGAGGNTNSSQISLTINPPGNRSTGVGVATDLTVTQRFNGTAWVKVNTFKRFNGSSWVDITN
jgi:hypothetical protein